MRNDETGSVQVLYWRGGGRAFRGLETGLNKRNIVMAAVAVAALATALAWMNRPQPVRVVVTEVETGDVVATVGNTRAGTVDACRRAGLSPAAGGQLASLPVREGDAVVAGQELLQLWNEDLRAELLLARRDAAASEAGADELCVRAEVADKEARRLTRLRERGLASDEETDRAVGDARARNAACKAARERIRVSGARVAVAEARLERTILRAPFDGVIAEINGELGEYVTPSPVGIPTPPTIDLIDTSCLFISAPIDEVDAPAVRAGQRAMITLDAFAEQSFPGVVRRVAPYVLDLEKQARTVEIEAVIDGDRNDRLLPGYSADVEVILATRENVIRVPSQTILNGDQVFVLEDGYLRERNVETGVTNWDYAEIVSGLSSGETVVLSVDRDGVEDGAAAVPD